MYFKLMRRLRYVLLGLVLLVMACSRSARDSTPGSAALTLAAPVDTFAIWSPARANLSKAYSLQHYGKDSYTISPQMIVVHYTVIPTRAQTLAYFAADTIAANRTRIAGHSQLNVSSHYVVDRNGSITHLLADTIMARHVIGYNHVAVGIENVARNAEELSEAQLSANVQLIRLLCARHPQISYVIGHHEYNRRDLPHYTLYLSKDSSYQAYDKPDPGSSFMHQLRDSLRMYQLNLHP